MPAYHSTCCLLLIATLLSAPAARADSAVEVRAMLARGDSAGALDRAAAAAAADPGNASTRFLLGVVLMEMLRGEEALQVFSLLSQEFPELPDPYNNIALLHARAGRLELARQSLESALRSDPGHRTARSNLGQVHLMLAVQAWEQAAADGPLDAAVMRRLQGARLLLAAPGLSPPGAR